MLQVDGHPHVLSPDGEHFDESLADLLAELCPFVEVHVHDFFSDDEHSLVDAVRQAHDRPAPPADPTARRRQRDEITAVHHDLYASLAGLLRICLTASSRFPVREPVHGGMQAPTAMLTELDSELAIRRSRALSRRQRSRA